MSAEITANKALVDRYFEAVASGKLTDAIGLLADDVRWIVPGSWELSGTFVGPAVHEMLAGFDQFVGGLNFHFHSVTAEENRVVVHTGVLGELRDGRQYQNEIVFLFELRGGQIEQVIEMPDSAHSRKFWLNK